MATKKVLNFEEKVEAYIQARDFQMKINPDGFILESLTIPELAFWFVEFRNQLNEEWAGKIYNHGLNAHGPAIWNNAIGDELKRRRELRENGKNGYTSAN